MYKSINCIKIISKLQVPILLYIIRSVYKKYKVSKL